MTKILHIQSSPRGDMSHSLELSQVLLEKLGGEVTTREIFTDTPFMQMEQIAYMYGFAEHNTVSEGTKSAIAYQDAGVQEVLSTDIIVLTTPLWNLGTPASVKAWFDQIIKVGQTWKKDEAGNYVGLATNIKKVYIVGTSAGVPVGVGHPWDFLAGHTTALFQFIGAQSVEVIWATGGDEELEKSMNAAKEKIKNIESLHLG